MAMKEKRLFATRTSSNFLKFSVGDAFDCFRNSTGKLFMFLFGHGEIGHFDLKFDLMVPGEVLLRRVVYQQQQNLLFTDYL